MPRSIRRLVAPRPRTALRWLAPLPFLVAGAACAPGLPSGGEPVGSAALAQGGPNYGESWDGVVYGEGALMTAPVTVHLVFYGPWPNGVSANVMDLFTNLVNNLGDSPIWGVATTYFDTQGNRVKRDIHVGTVVVDSGSLGNSLDQDAMQQLVDDHIAAGHLPSDNDAVYVILGASGVDASSASGKSMCTGFCGFHFRGDDLPNGFLKVAYVGDPVRCQTLFPPGQQNGCFKVSGNSSQSPNGLVGPDAMANTLFHEVLESITSPDAGSQDGWTNGFSSAVEIMDMCESGQTGGPVYHAANGSNANVHLGTRDYLLQAVWQNALYGGCVRKLSFTTPNATPSAGPGMAMAGDFDGDGIADILVRDAAGDIGVWLMDANGHRRALQWIGSAGPAFQMAGIGDFDGDGTSDILWRALTNGKLFIWHFHAGTNGGVSLTTEPLADTLPWRLQVAAVGDFNRNGKADILFTEAALADSDGDPLGVNRFYLWSSGVSPSSFTFDGSTNDLITVSLSSGAAATANLGMPRFLGTGDFDGDGFSDLLLRDAGGDLHTWMFQGHTVTGSHLVHLGDAGISGVTTIVSSKLANELVVGIADVDGDGTADIVVRTAPVDNTWQVGAALMSGGTVRAGAGVLINPSVTLPDRWEVAEVGMFGFPEKVHTPGILWRDQTTGDIRLWQLAANGTFLAQVAVGTATLDQEVVRY